ncbi:hypothetical protein D3C73_1380530 [compost metagenome]
MAGTWNGPHLVFGGFHIWKDANGYVRISASTPTSDTNGSVYNTNQSGTTAARPTVGLETGITYFDKTLNKPIWRNTANNGWVDATGATV